jgi:hypothetical protein
VTERVSGVWLVAFGLVGLGANKGLALTIGAGFVLVIGTLMAMLGRGK